jgi:hypothetical protein
MLTGWRWTGFRTHEDIMKASRRAGIAAMSVAVALHSLAALWVWRSWGTFGRGNVLAWLDFPVSLAYLRLEGAPLLFWSLIAGGLQWAAIAAVLTWAVGRSAR